LVRKLDDSTKQAYKPDAATKKYLASVFKDLPKGVKAPDLEKLTLYKPGVSEASPFGYKGRLVVMEQMVVTDAIQAYLRGDVSQVNTEAIEATAKQQGMLTILQDGVLKACAGLTTIEEVNRVI